MQKLNLIQELINIPLHSLAAVPTFVGCLLNVMKYEVWIIFRLQWPIGSNVLNYGSVILSRYCDGQWRDPHTYMSLPVLKYSVKIILAIDQLNAQILVFLISLLYSSTCFEHCCAHHQMVKLYCTASGIVTLCRWPSGAPVHWTAIY